MRNSVLWKMTTYYLGGGEIALTEISAAEDVLLLKKFEVDQNCMHTYIIICGRLQP